MKVPYRNKILALGVIVFSIFQSLDAEWNRYELSDSSLQFITYGKGVYVAGVRNPTTYISDLGYSTDLNNWTTQVLSGSFPNIDFISFVDDEFWMGLQAGGRGTLYRSSDGKSFTTVTMKSLIFHLIKTDSGLYVTAGGGGGSYNIHTSEDAVTWTTHSTGTQSYIDGLVSGNGRIVAIATSNQNDGIIPIISTDNGATWVQHTVVPSMVMIRGVEYFNDQFVMVGNRMSVRAGETPFVVVLTSTDGITWNEQSVEGFNQTAGLAQADGKLYFAGSNDANELILVSSSDGNVWESEVIGDASSLRFITSMNDLVIIHAGILGGDILYTNKPLSGLPEPAPAPWQSAVSLGDGVYSLDWFGVFSVDADGWIYHEQYGWLYSESDTTSSLWFYDPNLNKWWWTSEDDYPAIYVADGNWYFHTPI